MKKILLSILGIFFGLSAFCSAEDYHLDLSSTQNAGGSYQINYSYLNLEFTNSSSNFYINSVGGFSRHDPYLYYEIYNLSDNSFLFSGEFISGSNGYTLSNFLGVDVSIYTGIQFKYYFTKGSYISYRYSIPLESTGFNIIGFYNPYGFVQNGFILTSLAGIDYSFQSSDSFTVNYGNQSKEYEIISDVDIYINSPVSKDGSTFTFDGSTGINLVYNGQYNWYTKNKLYLDGQFWYRQGVFTPICL